MPILLYRYDSIISKLDRIIVNKIFYTLTFEKEKYSQPLCRLNKHLRFTDDGTNCNINWS